MADGGLITHRRERVIIMLLSVVVPLLNEKNSLVELHRRLVAVSEKIGCDREIIFVDDGSTDGSDQVIREIAKGDPAVTGLRLSRNFGHEAASTAGLDAAHGDITVLMDADLQDPPELIEDMHKLWKEGNQVVYAVRRRRPGESAVKLTAAWMFYRALNFLSDVSIPLDVGDFRLMDIRVLQSLRECRETDRFVRGLVAWTGFRSAAIQYDRPARSSGQTHYGIIKLFALSLDAFFGFSISPLRIASVVGVIAIAVSLFAMLIVMLARITDAIDSVGSPLIGCGLFFLGGIQLLSIGILGEYIGRIYRESQDRPLYLVAEEITASDRAAQREGQKAAA
jgi:polyisoprenyl-phosphate glycosyltransferase